VEHSNASEVSNGASPMRGRLNLDEAARSLGVHRPTVEHLVAEASIGVVRIGQGRGPVIIRVSEADRYLADHEKPAISARQSGCAGGRGEGR
jgi:excisionase family DNA binding protein